MSILFAITITSLLFSNLLITGIATTARYASNFNDTIPETAYVVNDNTYGNMENLAVYYNLFEGSLIITGVSYMYANYGPGTGPYDVEIRFEGDSFWVGYFDSGIPDVGLNASWRTFRCTGPTYLIDDNPWVRFIGTDPSDNCIALCGDTPSIGNSWYDVGSGWTLDPNVEYIVELIYEWIISMNVGEIKTGIITTTDFVDAYFVTLSAGITYEFELDRTSGLGNLNMRLVVNQDLTNNVLAQSSGSSDPEYMTYTPSSTDTYVLLVEPNIPNTDTADYSIRYYVEETPTADFTSNITTIFEGESVQFTFNGTEGNTPATYLWDFGDSTPTSTEQNPIHQYNSAGSYTVDLTVTDSDGDIDNEVKANYIVVETDIVPIADFSANKINISQGENVQFTFTGSEGNAPATYLWDFGDGSPTSIEQNPLHQYFDVGVFNVSLLITDRNGDFDFIKKIDYITVNLNELPLANFTVNETTIKEGEWVNFTFTGIEGTIPATFQWDFGDGSPISTERNPIHQYNSSGLFSVILNVTDNNGDSDVETKVDYITVNIDLLPNADFSINTSVLIGEGWVNFTFIGEFGDLPTTFLWDFGDGGPTSNDQNPLHYYNIVGNFTVTLTVTDNDGDIDIETKINLISVISDISPVVNFIVDKTTIDVGESVQFTFIGSEGNTPATFEWGFGDASPISTEKNPTHIYNTPGTYSVSLKIVDYNGDSDNLTIVNYILVEEIQLSININNPEMNAVYGQSAPAYCIIVIGDNIDLLWYTLNGGTSLYHITALTDLIDQAAWDALPEGHVIIRFYAQDTEERSCYKDVIIIKDFSVDGPPTPSPPGIPGYDLTLIIGTISIINVILVMKILKRKGLFFNKKKISSKYN